MTQGWGCMRWCCCCGRLSSVREAITRSVVGRRRLVVYLAVRTTLRTKALRGAVRFRSVFGTGDDIALDFDGLLRFDQILIQLLHRGTPPIELFVQLTNVLKQHLFLHFHLSESCLVLREIIMHVFIGVVQVCNLAVLLQQLLSVVLDLLLQTPDVTLKFSQCCLVTALFCTLIFWVLVRC